MKISVQLYTLRDLLAVDMPAVLKKLKAIGYPAAELAGYGNLKSAAEVREAFDAAGLAVSGSHVSIDRLKNDIDGVIAEQKTLGNTNVVLAWLDADLRKNAADWRGLAATANEAGRQLKAAGLRFLYHNHAFEFEQFDGGRAFDIFWQHTDPELVKSELDVYWVKLAGLDPVAYMKQLGTRVKILHLKDMAAGEGNKFAPVGTGTIDFAAVLKTANDLGVEWGAVEQDNCYGEDPLKIVATSFENLRKLGAI
ncbi:MAG TPA: sugar phosphate isomerase/epimerase [Tepidisphaeraceae bacterium]